MEPLILKFAEKSINFSSEPPEYKYSEELNLNVLNNGQFAINNNHFATETGTRQAREDSDSDKNMVGTNLLATESFTKATGEGSDTDKSDIR